MEQAPFGQARGVISRGRVRWRKTTNRPLELLWARPHRGGKPSSWSTSRLSLVIAPAHDTFTIVSVIESIRFIKSIVVVYVYTLPSFGG